MFGQHDGQASAFGPPTTQTHISPELAAHWAQQAQQHALRHPQSAAAHQQAAAWAAQASGATAPAPMGPLGPGAAGPAPTGPPGPERPPGMGAAAGLYPGYEPPTPPMSSAVSSAQIQSGFHHGSWERGRPHSAPGTAFHTPAQSRPVTPPPKTGWRRQTADDRHRWL